MNLRKQQNRGTTKKEPCFTNKINYNKIYIYSVLEQYFFSAT